MSIDATAGFTFAAIGEDHVTQMLEGVKHHSDDVAKSLEGVERASNDVERSQGKLGRAFDGAKGRANRLLDEVDRVDGVKSKWEMFLGVIEFIAPAAEIAVAVFEGLFELFDDNSSAMADLVGDFDASVDAMYDMRDAMRELAKQSAVTQSALFGMRQEVIDTAISLAEAEGNLEEVARLQRERTHVGLKGQAARFQERADEAHETIAKAHARIAVLQAEMAAADATAAKAFDESLISEERIRTATGERVKQARDTTGRRIHDALVAKANLQRTQNELQIKQLQESIEAQTKVIDMSLSAALNLDAELERRVAGGGGGGSKPSRPQRRARGAGRSSRGRQGREKPAPDRFEEGEFAELDYLAELEKRHAIDDAEAKEREGRRDEKKRHELALVAEQAEAAREQVAAVDEALKNLTDTFTELQGPVAEMVDIWDRYAGAQISAQQAVVSSVAAIAVAGAQQIADEQTRAAVLAAIEFGLGWASIAEYDYAAAAAHFTAAAALGVAAATGGGSGGAAGGAGAGGRSRQRESRERDRRFGGDAEGPQDTRSVTVVQFPQGVVLGRSQDIAREVERARRSSRGTGYDRAGGV